MRLKGKVALISGAAKGIGAATAALFAREGCCVVLGDVRNELCNETAERIQGDGGSAICVPLDVTDPGQWENAVRVTLDTHGRIDVLVNNAGIQRIRSSFDEVTLRDWEDIMTVNATGVFLGAKSVVGPMKTQRGGSIVNMASLSSHLLGVPDRAAYTATKAAVIGITKSVAKDYLSDNIRVNAIAPATVETPSLEERIKATGNAEAARAAFIARQPMGRVGTPEEIANLAVYLASDESSYTTGQVHVIDGAMSL